MGQCNNKPTHRDPELAQENKKIDQSLRKEHQQMKQTAKLLILGSGGGGKSTFLSQIRILYGQGLEEFSLDTVASNLRDNLVDLGIGLLRGFSKDGVVATGEEVLFGPNKLHTLEPSKSFAEGLTSLHACYTTIQETLDEGHKVSDFREYAARFETLINDAYFKESVLGQLELLRIGDSSRYLLENFKRICADDFKPTRDDLLRMRVRTAGVQDYSFKFRGTSLQLTDVGGQRSERSKWIHCFTEVSCLLFFVSMAEYDLVLEEDGATNRMLESLTLFEEVTNSRWFANTPVALFLNKRDIFEKKMLLKPLNKFFGEFPPGGTVEQGQDFILQKFKDSMGNPKMLTSFFTVATDTNLIEQVFSTVASAVLAVALGNTVF